MNLKNSLFILNRGICLRLLSVALIITVWHGRELIRLTNSILQIIRYKLCNALNGEVKYVSGNEFSALDGTSKIDFHRDGDMSPPEYEASFKNSFHISCILIYFFSCVCSAHTSNWLPFRCMSCRFRHSPFLKFHTSVIVGMHLLHGFLYYPSMFVTGRVNTFRDSFGVQFFKRMALPFCHFNCTHLRHCTSKGIQKLWNVYYRFMYKLHFQSLQTWLSQPSQRLANLCFIHLILPVFKYKLGC